MTATVTEVPPSVRTFMASATDLLPDPAQKAEPNLADRECKALSWTVLCLVSWSFVFLLGPSRKRQITWYCCRGFTRLGPLVRSQYLPPIQSTTYASISNISQLRMAARMAHVLRFGHGSRGTNISLGWPIVNRCGSRIEQLRPVTMHSTDGREKANRLGCRRFRARLCGSSTPDLICRRKSRTSAAVHCRSSNKAPSKTSRNVPLAIATDTRRCGPCKGRAGRGSAGPFGYKACACGSARCRRRAGASSSCPEAVCGASTRAELDRALCGAVRALRR